MWHTQSCCIQSTHALLTIKLYLLSKPLDYWNSRQVDIGSCSALPSHWPNTETKKKPNVIKSHEIATSMIEFTLLQVFKEQKYYLSFCVCLNFLRTNLDSDSNYTLKESSVFIQCTAKLRTKTKLNSVASVRERTIQTERPACRQS
jgi:hypothetical protein